MSWMTSWVTLLAVAVVLVVIAALTGARPDDTKPVAQTRLMKVARIILVVVAAILVVVAFLFWQGAS